MLSKESIALVEKKIAKNKKEFDKWLHYVRKAPNDEEALYRIWGAALFVTSFYCGILSCPKLEEELIRIAKTIPFESSNITYTPNSFLHIFTSTENYGGHARVVERWIQNAPQGQIHSVLYTDQRFDPVSDIIYKKTKERNGEVIIQPSLLSFKEKAVQLREIATRYEYIILHINRNDIVPILAFGSLDFKRPVLFFNHTDHLCWIGGCIADAVINFRHFSEQINIQRRGIDRNLYLPLPMEISESGFELKKDSDRKTELGIPSNHKVIISMARNTKYVPEFGLDFVSTVGKILDRIDNLSFVVIGPSLKENYWQALSDKYPRRVHVLGVIPNEETSSYLSMADLAWDSFPLGSLYSLMESAKLGVPVLSLSTPGIQGLYDGANIMCDSVDELIQTSFDLLQGNIPYRGRLLDFLRDNNSGDGWKQHLTTALSQIPNNHQLWPVEQPKAPITEFELFSSTLEHRVSAIRIQKYFPYYYIYLISRMQKLRLKHPRLVAFLRNIVLRMS